MIIHSGLYNTWKTVKNVSDICSDLTVTANNGYQECPDAGKYTLKTYFTVPSIPDFYLQYTPDLKIYFFEATTKERLGCSTTGTIAMRLSAQEGASQGLIALTVVIAAFCIIFGMLLYLSYRRKKRLENLSEEKKHSYRYFRTLPNGQVIPLPSQKKGPPTPTTTTVLHNAEAMNISNPSYNETNLPTRPII